MERRDTLGRRRGADQNRGLRPLFPRLPAGVRSRLIRVAMAAAAWDRLDVLVAQSSAPSLPRAYGELLEGWLGAAATGPQDAAAIPPSALAPALVADWQDWQMRKELALLAMTRRPEPGGASVH